MQSSGQASDVVVVGGGVIGLASAWRLARDGATVRVVDVSGTRGASWAAAGMLAPVSESAFGEEELLRLNLAALERFPTFAAELEDTAGQPVGLRREGTLVVALDNDDRAALARLTSFRAGLGFPTEELTGSAARRLEPYLSSQARAAVLAPGDLSVDNRRYVAALRAACAAAGVDLVEGRVAELQLDGGRTTGVRTDDGRVWSARTVVLAAGPWSRALAGLPSSVAPPVRPVKGQILRLGLPEGMSAAGPVLSHTVRAIARGSEVYLVPRADGELVVGATSEEKGFDETVTAGGAYQLLRDAQEVLPIIGELTLVEARAGLRPGTPDNGPIVGGCEVPGLVVATGHYRNGILLSALTADAVVRLVAGEATGPEWASFAPARFSRGAAA